MGLFTDRKNLMRCLEHLEEKVMVDKYYRSSERGKAGWLQQVLLAFFFSVDLMVQFGSEQDLSHS